MFPVGTVGDEGRKMGGGTQASNKAEEGGEQLNHSRFEARQSPVYMPRVLEDVSGVTLDSAIKEECLVLSLQN